MPDPEEAFAPVLEAVRLVRAALRPDQAVVGFCGGPFTVAGYLVEGKPSREFALTKRLMLGEPDVWHALLEKLSETFAAYVAAKARAGADVIQLFDSWVGALSPAHYRELRRAALGARPRRRRRAHDPLRHRHRDAARGDGGRRRRRDRARLAHPARHRLGRGARIGPCRAISIRPCCWRRGRVVEAEALDVLAGPAAVPGTSSTSVTACFPSVDPDTLTRLAALVRERSASSIAVPA